MAVLVVESIFPSPMIPRRNPSGGRDGLDGRCMGWTVGLTFSAFIAKSASLAIPDVFDFIMSTVGTVPVIRLGFPLGNGNFNVVLHQDFAECLCAAHIHRIA